MTMLIGSRGSDTLVGTSSSDVIYGYDPNASSPPAVAANVIVSGLNNPLYITSAPNDANHLFILEKGGLVKVYETSTGQTLSTPFFNVSSQIATSGEQGLLGLAFAPDFATSRTFYVYLSTPNQDVEIREYKTSVSNPLIADAASMRLITRIDYPSSTTNHRGGWIGFGPDGYLYAATGDGAVRANAQSLDSQLGKIIRLDVNADAFPADPNRNYALQADNPASIAGIEGSAVGTSIYAAGLRNPWRVSFDRLTGEMYIGDVGEGAFEEINLGRSGANYGWSITEGPFSPGSFPAYTNPIYSYGRDLGQSVTGGYVYRGPERDFQGTYFFSDFLSSDIWSLQRASETWRFSDLTASVAVGGGPIGNVSSLGEDASGNLYIVDLGGRVFRLDLTSGVGPNPADDAGDILSGGGGSDRISAGGGNDRLEGDRGRDTLTGGSGATSSDTFVFDAKLKNNIDRITDLEPAFDQIHLDDRFFKGLSTGAPDGTPLRKGMFVANADGEATIEDKAQIVYETDTGRLFYDADGEGGKDTVKFAVLTARPNLTIRDFEVT